MACFRSTRLAAAALSPMLGALALLAAASAAKAGPSLVVEAASGAVLHQEQATRPWYPASLTKLMTVYVALDTVRRGDITLKTPLRVSARARRAAPSKMGFRVGTEVTLENALKIIMVKSANDVSITIAEGIAGSVEGFSAKMNATARQLGMRQSHFVNPNGLHHPNHVSSARDMAVLARALLLHFPQHKHMYGIGAIRLGRRVMRTHNGVIGRYPGADGMKTGFVCASGYNVVASASRYGKQIIAVVMGAPNGRLRTLKAMALMDKGFAANSFGVSRLESLPPSGYVAAPNMRPHICTRSGRRQMISQFHIPSTSGFARSGARAYADDDNPAAFFAADRGQRGFGRSGDNGDDDNGGSSRFKLPPRAPLVPVPIYVGRAPGWTGQAAGPAEPAAEPDNKPAVAAASPDAKPDTPDAKQGVRASVNAEPGKPVALRGAVLGRKNTPDAKPAARATRRKATRSRNLRRGRNARRGRSARRGRVIRRSRATTPRRATNRRSIRSRNIRRGRRSRR